MQSYKLRKIIETVLFPIEEDIKDIKEQNEKNWTSLMWQIFSVVFSGIGTTLLCQDNFIPTWINALLQRNEEVEQAQSSISLFLLEFFVAILFFGVFCLIFLKISAGCIALKDRKGSEKERRKLIEYFHKVILNNILTGISFTKKAKSRNETVKDLNMQMEKEEDESRRKQFEKEHDAIQEEIELYACEAIYYFEIAEKQIRKKNIFEVGNRNNYRKFVDEIGIVTLRKTLSMYERALNELKSLRLDADVIVKANEISGYVYSCKKRLKDK